MKGSLAQYLIPVVISWATMPVATGAELTDSVNLGLGGVNPMPHCNAKVYLIEYEHQITPVIAALGRGSGVKYWFDDGQYQEDGRLRGLDAGIRYYPAGGMLGLFIGGSLGYWRGDWTFFQNKGTPAGWQGKAGSNSLRLNFEVGDRIPIPGTSVSVMPELSFGKFFSSMSCDATAPASRHGMPCSQSSEVDYYIFLGVTAGIAF